MSRPTDAPQPLTAREALEEAAFGFEDWWQSQSAGMRNPASKETSRRGWHAALRALAASLPAVDGRAKP